MRKIYLQLVLVSLFAACSPTAGPDKSIAGAILGAGWGAGAGAVIGNQSSNTGPGIAIGSGFGAASGMLTGIGLDMAEGTELEQQRELDALKVQLDANTRTIRMMQASFDSRRAQLQQTTSPAQIYFDQGKASLRAGTVAQLQQMAQLIKLNPYIGKIELQGHSDDMGNLDNNMRLSEARARTVAAFLGAQGISMDQMVVTGYGAQRPLATNENDAGRQLNRRVEVILLK